MWLPWIIASSLAAPPTFAEDVASLVARGDGGRVYQCDRLADLVRIAHAFGKDVGPSPLDVLTHAGLSADGPVREVSHAHGTKQEVVHVELPLAGDVADVPFALAAWFKRAASEVRQDGDTWWLDDRGDRLVARLNDSVLVVDRERPVVAERGRDAVAVHGERLPEGAGCRMAKLDHEAAVAAYVPSAGAQRPAFMRLRYPELDAGLGAPLQVATTMPPIVVLHTRASVPGAMFAGDTQAGAPPLEDLKIGSRAVGMFVLPKGALDAFSVVDAAGAPASGAAIRKAALRLPDMKPHRGLLFDGHRYYGAAAGVLYRSVQESLVRDALDGGMPWAPEADLATLALFARGDLMGASFGAKLTWVDGMLEGEVRANAATERLAEAFARDRAGRSPPADAPRVD